MRVRAEHQAADMADIRVLSYNAGIMQGQAPCKAVLSEVPEAGVSLLEVMINTTLKYD